MASNVTGIEFLSKTRTIYPNELSFAGRGLKLDTKEHVQEIVSAIQKTEKMEVLRLEGNTIAPEAAEELAVALAQHPEMQRFIVNDIFTSRGKESIPLSLRSICGAINTSGARLVEINMSDNAFGLTALVDFFQSESCFSLREIRMHNNGLGPQGAQKFAGALSNCYDRSNGRFLLQVFICGRNRLEYEGSVAISKVLKKMGSLEEIQMPQNGIRKNGIEFVAEMCAQNQKLRIINLNDNTLVKAGGEWMAKALSNLPNLEYINFGDCLLKNKGAIQVVRALEHNTKLKELVLSFNEIDATTGLEIARLMSKKTTLILLDLDGNRFGKEGSIDIFNILNPALGEHFNGLEEDEGSEADEDDRDEDDEDDQEEDEEDEEGHIVVDGEEEEDYEDGEYDEEDDEGEYDDDEDYDENGEEGEYDEENNYENFNIADHQPQPSLFTSFAGKPVVIPNLQKINLNANNCEGNVNLFAQMIKDKETKNALITNIATFDSFIMKPDITNLKALDDATLTSVTQSSKFNVDFLMRVLAQMSKVSIDPNSNDWFILLNCANVLTNAYVNQPDRQITLGDEILTYLGLLKSEDKKFVPLVADDTFFSLLGSIFKQAYFPNNVKNKINEYLKIKQDSSPTLNSSSFKKNSEKLIHSLS